MANDPIKQVFDGLFLCISTDGPRSETETPAQPPAPHPPSTSGLLVDASPGRRGDWGLCLSSPSLLQSQRLKHGQLGGLAPAEQAPPPAPAELVFYGVFYGTKASEFGLICRGVLPKDHRFTMNKMGA